MKVYQFKNTSVNHGFNYFFERVIPAHTTIAVKMPAVTANKRGINDISWQTDGDNVELYGTLSNNVGDENALWAKIDENSEVNKAVSGLKIKNSGAACRFIIRVIMN